MKPKEKAAELLKIFTDIDSYNVAGNGKSAAIAAVGQLIAEHSWGNPISWNVVRKKYWEAVKQELENL